MTNDQPIPPPPFFQALIDRAAAGAKEAHGPGHSQEWYEAVGRRFIWGAAMSGVPRLDLGRLPHRGP